MVSTIGIVSLSSGIILRGLVKLEDLEVGDSKTSDSIYLFTSGFIKSIPKLVRRIWSGAFLIVALFMRRWKRYLSLYLIFLKMTSYKVIKQKIFLASRIRP